MSNQSSLSGLNNGYIQKGVQNAVHRSYIQDFFEKFVRPKVSRTKDFVRKIKDIFPVFVRGKKYTKYVFG